MDAGGVRRQGMDGPRMLVDAFIWLWVNVMFPGPIGRCDPAPGDKLHWTTAERQEARDMANESVRARGARPIFVAYLDSVTIRESSAFASRWHDGGAGLGMHGINITTHRKRWPTPLNPAICSPRVSAAIVQDIAADCLTRHGASTAWELQACFAGRFQCTPNGEGECTGPMQDRTTSAICERMQNRGFRCHGPITLKDLGRRMTLDERLALGAGR
jgi:hypothetical protein